MQGEEIDLADGTEIGAHLGLYARWQSHFREPFQHLDAIPIVLRFVVENQHQAGEPKKRYRPQMLQMGYAVDDILKWNRDLLLDLFGRDPWPLGDHLDVVIRHIRIGFHRKAPEGNHAPGEQEDGYGYDQKPVLESEIDGSTNHRRSAAFRKVFGVTGAFETARRPGLIPETILAVAREHV